MVSFLAGGYIPAMKIYAGTSGYSYPEWKGYFYPEDLPNTEMLEYYGSKLPSVEINNTFYRLPNAGMIEKWSGSVPASFRFSLKAAQKITHVKRLKNAQDETAYLFKTVKALGEKLGVVLFQCPPNFRKDIDRLQEFLSTLPNDARSAFEFRHASWFDEDVFAILRNHDAAFCIADTDEELTVPFVSTAKWGYLRLRRPDYSSRDLTQWYRKVSEQSWETAFVFFKHEDKGVGANLALEFIKLSAPKGGGSRKKR